MDEKETITIKNPWKIISLIFLIVIITLIFLNYFQDVLNTKNKNPLQGIRATGEVDGKTAGEKAAAFLDARSSEDIAYVSYSDLGSIYEITISYQDESLPVYITKDGNYFIQTAIPVSADHIS